MPLQKAATRSQVATIRSLRYRWRRQPIRLKDLGKVSGGSFLPETDSSNNVKTASAAGKASLYDARGQLKSAASNVGGQAQDFASANVDSMKSKFEQRLLAAQKKAQEQVQTKSEAFKSGTLKANDQINAFANVSPQTQDTFNQPFPKIAADGSFIPPSPKRPVDLNANQMALQPRSNSLLPINKPNALSPNSFAGASNGSVSQMGMEVEEYKRQIASLKAQVAAANRSSASATPSPRQPSSYPAVAQNTIEGVVLPLDKVNNAFDPRAGNPVANQIQNQPYSPAATNPYTPATPSNSFNTGQGSNSFYPATPHGGFGSTTQPKTGVGHAGFNSPDEFQNQVSQASNNESGSIYSGPLKASRIDSSVSEVLIPSSILSGRSSFTPGSTTPLR